ncbi:hypothetical protein GA0115240_11703 [Streptomyces sp. DvalAA-14]|nr:hypothetical protein GA0115240_11703 [Streptomyces sp. DvalAA-14]
MSTKAEFIRPSENGVGSGMRMTDRQKARGEQE